MRTPSQLTLSELLQLHCRRVDILRYPSCQTPKLAFPSSIIFPFALALARPRLIRLRYQALSRLIFPWPLRRGRPGFYGKERIVEFGRSVFCHGELLSGQRKARLVQSSEKDDTGLEGVVIAEQGVCVYGIDVTVDNEMDRRGGRVPL